MNEKLLSPPPTTINITRLIISRHATYLHDHHTLVLLRESQGGRKKFKKKKAQLHKTVIKMRWHSRAITVKTGAEEMTHRTARGNDGSILTAIDTWHRFVPAVVTNSIRTLSNVELLSFQVGGRRAEAMIHKWKPRRKQRWAAQVPRQNVTSESRGHAECLQTGKSCKSSRPPLQMGAA